MNIIEISSLPEMITSNFTSNSNLSFLYSFANILIIYSVSSKHKLTSSFYKSCIIRKIQATGSRLLKSC